MPDGDDADGYEYEGQAPEDPLHQDEHPPTTRLSQHKPLQQQQAGQEEAGGGKTGDLLLKTCSPFLNHTNSESRETGCLNLKEMKKKNK